MLVDGGSSAGSPFALQKNPFNPIPVAFGMGSGGAGSFCQGIKRTHPLKLQKVSPGAGHEGS